MSYQSVCPRKGGRKNKDGKDLKFKCKLYFSLENVYRFNVLNYTIYGKTFVLISCLKEFSVTMNHLANFMYTKTDREREREGRWDLNLLSL